MAKISKIDEIFQAHFGSFIKQDSETQSEYFDTALSNLAKSLSEYCLDFCYGKSYYISPPTPEQVTALAELFNISVDAFNFLWKSFYSTVKTAISETYLHPTNKKLTIEIPISLLSCLPLLQIYFDQLSYNSQIALLTKRSLLNQILQQYLDFGSKESLPFLEQWLTTQIYPIAENDLYYGISYQILESPLEIQNFVFARINGFAVTNLPHIVVHHSPTGFEWGYSGSGPSELALNLAEYICFYNDLILPRVPVYQNYSVSLLAWERRQTIRSYLNQNLSRENQIVYIPYQHLANLVT